MTKDEVVKIINSDLSDSAKYGALTQSLNKAPVKNLSLVNFYNRSGFSKARLKTLEYDVKKAFNISKADLSAKVDPKSAKSKPVDAENTEDVQTDFDIQVALNADFASLNYHKELKPLANDVADFLGEELKSQKKADLIAYLEEKKSSLDPNQYETE